MAKQTAALAPEVDSQEEAADSVLDTAVKDLKASYDYLKTGYHQQWDKYYSAYSNIRTERNYDSVADTFIPITFSTVETLVAHVAGGKPRFSYAPTTPEQTGDVKILNHYVTYTWDKMNMPSKSITWARDMIMYGTGVMLLAPNGNQFEATNIPIKDFRFDPTATDPDNLSCSWMGYEYLTTKLALKQMMDIDDNGNLVRRYDDALLEKLEEEDGDDSDGNKLDKKTKDMFNGSTLGTSASEEQVRIFFMITGPTHKYPNRLIEIGNGKVTLRNIETPFAKEKIEDDKEDATENPDTPDTDDVGEWAIEPFYPFAICRNYVDAPLLLGRGDVQYIYKLNELINDTSNQKVDNISYVLDNMWTIDPAYADRAREIESVPGAVYDLPHGALQPIEKPQVTQEADNEIGRLKQDIRDTSAASEVVQGQQESGNATATEINAQVNQAGQRFAVKLQMLEAEGYKQFGQILFKLTQLFVTDKMMLRIAGGANGELQWKDFDIADYEGEYEPSVQLDATIKAQKMEQATKYTNLMETLLQVETINKSELIKLSLQKIWDVDEDEVEKLLTPDQQAMQAQQQQMQMQMQAAAQQAQAQAQAKAQAVAPKPILNYKDAPEDIKRQMEQADGYQQSQMASPVAHGQNLQAMQHHLALNDQEHKQSLDIMNLIHGRQDAGNAQGNQQQQMQMQQQAQEQQAQQAPVGASGR